MQNRHTEKEGRRHNKRFERKQGETPPFELFCSIWSVVFASTVVLKILPASSRLNVVCYILF